MKKIMSLCLLLWLLPSTAYAAVEQTIEDVINWKKNEQQLDAHSPLLQNPFLKAAGSTAGDWFPFAMGRIGYTDDYDAYLAVLEQQIMKRYETEQQLDATKATEWHRISLAMLAVGGDATNVNGIDLIADGTYNRPLRAPLNLQGVNGYIWGLLTLDSMRYIVPEQAAITRQAIIEGILATQLQDGGFSLYNDATDVDMTAMALQALAPYANSFQQFTYKQLATGQTVVKSVRTAVEEALAILSELQLENGGFGSWGEPNTESTAQVIIALSALQIDPLTDARFIKNGVTVLDGLLAYQQDDGGFIHAKNYNADNPTSLPDTSNSMASEQALMALVAYKRMQGGYRALYDVRAEMTPQQHAQLEALEARIQTANLQAVDEVTQLLQLYAAIPASDVMYIDDFERVQQAVETLQIDFATPQFTEMMGEQTHGTGTMTPILQHAIQMEITLDMVDAFLAQGSYTTADYNTALRYIRYAQQQPLAEQLAALLEVRQAIEALQQEIDALNALILNELYPIQAITLADKQTVEQVLARFQALHVTDQQQIIDYEALQQAEALLDSLQREQWLKRGIVFVIATLLVVMLYRLWKKRKGSAQ